jgi:GH24 family phage-related lysozyme (muramidase)
MTSVDDASTEIAVSEEALEAARSDREGLEWLLQDLEAQGGLESAQITNPPSKTPISQKAFDLIVEFEVSSEQVYERKYRAPVWPQGQSGATIGIGYDVGYTAVPMLHADWDGAVPAAMVSALETAIGVRGAPARAVAASLRGSVDVPFSAAILVHRSKVMPRWVGLAESRLPNTGMLNADSLGALVSLIYNRGASFDQAGDRFTEMRAIKSHMRDRAFARIPDDFRSMKRLWPDVPGLQARREREARLFEAGLAATPVA